MDKPKKEPILISHRQDYRLCLNCGFPNRNSDAHCMYCNAGLVEETGLFSWVKQTYYILRWRWQLKQHREKRHSSGQERLPLWKGASFFLLGAGLSATGVYLFALALAEKSFSNGLMSVLFFFYGFFTIKTLLSKK